MAASGNRVFHRRRYPRHHDVFRSARLTPCSAASRHDFDATTSAFARTKQNTATADTPAEHGTPTRTCSGMSTHWHASQCQNTRTHVPGLLTTTREWGDRGSPPRPAQSHHQQLVAHAYTLIVHVRFNFHLTTKLSDHTWITFNCGIRLDALALFQRLSRMAILCGP